MRTCKGRVAGHDAWTHTEGCETRLCTCCWRLDFSWLLDVPMPYLLALQGTRWERRGCRFRRMPHVGIAQKMEDDNHIQRLRQCFMWENWMNDADHEYDRYCCGSATHRQRGAPPKETLKYPRCALRLSTVDP